MSWLTTLLSQCYYMIFNSKKFFHVIQWMFSIKIFYTLAIILSSGRVCSASLELPHYLPKKKLTFCCISPPPTHSIWISYQHESLLTLMKCFIAVIILMKRTALAQYILLSIYNFHIFRSKENIRIKWINHK